MDYTAFSLFLTIACMLLSDAFIFSLRLTAALLVYRTRLFCQAVLDKEDTEAFTWFFDHYVKMVDGKHPRVCFTDRCANYGGDVNDIIVSVPSSPPCAQPSHMRMQHLLFTSIAGILLRKLPWGFPGQEQCTSSASGTSSRM